MLLAAALACPLRCAQAQQYPTQDIHFICVFPPGSGADVLVRYFAEKVRPLTGKNVIVENRSGAGGNIAIEYVARAKPDGYTVLVHGASGVAASMSLFKSPPVDVGKTIQVAATINRQPFMVLVDAKSPYKTLADLTAAMKAKGDKASYATAAPFGTVVGEVYKLRHRRHRRSKSSTRTRSTRSTISSAARSTMRCTIRSMRWRSSAKGACASWRSSTAERLKANPDMPTLKELGVSDLNLMGWWAAMVPQGTPQAGDRSDQQMVRSGGRIGGDRQVSGKFGGDQLIMPPDKAQELFLQGDQELGRIRAGSPKSSRRAKVRRDAGGTRRQWCRA